MRVYNACGDAIPAPGGWVEDRCMTCSRDTETPIESARRQVLEGKKNGRIMVKGVTATTLNRIRAEATEAGDLQPDAAEQERRERADRQEAETLAAIEEALRADPAQTNGALTKRFGAGQGVVAEARERLGLRTAGEYQREREAEEMRQVLTENPGVSNHEMGKRLGCSGQRIKKIRDQLGLPQPVVRCGPKPGWQHRSNVGSN